MRAGILPPSASMARAPARRSWICSNTKASSSSPARASPCRRAARATVDEAVAAADEIGYPCVVKAQVKIGGRGKAGGIKVANDQDEAASTPRRSSAWTSRASPSMSSGSRARREIAAEYYASIIFDRSRQDSRWSCSPPRAAWTSRRSPRRTRSAIATLHVDPLLGFQDYHGRRLAFEGSVDADLVRPVGALPHAALRHVRRRGGDARRGQPADRHARALASPRSTRRSRSTTTRSSATRRTPSCATRAPRTRRSRWPTSAG